jgi:hypothetical protein
VDSETAARREFLQRLRLDIVRREAVHKGCDWLRDQEGVKVAREYVVAKLEMNDDQIATELSFEPEPPKQLISDEVSLLLKIETLPMPLKEMAKNHTAPWRIVRAVICGTQVIPERVRTIWGSQLSRFVSYSINVYAAPQDFWLANPTMSPAARRVFGRKTFDRNFPFLLKWSIARRYNQFRGIALELKTTSLIQTLPPRQSGKTSSAVTETRKVYFSRFLRRLLHLQNEDRVHDFLTEGMVSIQWVRASELEEEGSRRDGDKRREATRRGLSRRRSNSKKNGDLKKKIGNSALLSTIQEDEE